MAEQTKVLDVTEQVGPTTKDTTNSSTKPGTPRTTPKGVFTR